MTGIRVRAHHGVFEFEREQGQEFVIDVAVAVAQFHLHRLERLRVELGLELAALGVAATELVAAVVDLQPLHLPTLLRRPAHDRVAQLPLAHRHIVALPERI